MDHPGFICPQWLTRLARKQHLNWVHAVLTTEKNVQNTAKDESKGHAPDRSPATSKGHDKQLTTTWLWLELQSSESPVPPLKKRSLWLWSAGKLLIALQNWEYRNFYTQWSQGIVTKFPPQEARFYFFTRLNYQQCVFFTNFRPCFSQYYSSLFAIHCAPGEIFAAQECLSRMTLVKSTPWK